MSLIKKEKKLEFTQLNVKLETGVADKLKRYAEFLESTQAHVVSEAIHYIVDRDKDFAANGLARFGQNQLADSAAQELVDRTENSGQSAGRMPGKSGASR